ncbi:hypothetical protein HAX54_039538 [Datura stramonium]|uniref:Uncharacterized protein n=1 Tax=Datura stramonium TaxID=4076 RepID=A0ABS8VMT3_DATST|nr:hypothetical protein [Datura stramonium]
MTSSSSSSNINVPLSDTTPPSTQREPLFVPGVSSFTPPSYEPLSSTLVPPRTETPTTGDLRVNPDIGLGTDDIPFPDSLKERGVGWPARWIRPHCSRVITAAMVSLWRLEGTSSNNLDKVKREIHQLEAVYMGSQTEALPLLEDGGVLENENSGLYTGDGSVDIKGNPVLKSETGNWRACPFILGNECCERLAYYGIAANLVTYLTTKLHQGNVSAARNVTTWQGTCYLTPLIGAVLADAYWGRYWTIATFSTIYFIGMCTLTLSASVPAFKPPECVGSVCPSATPAQYAIFFFGLYLIALGTGGIKPCVSSFGADQFDDTDPKERVKKGSFFNWFYFSINIGALISSSLIVWIQENAGWGLGFGIPAVFMGIAIASFFFGTPLYRCQKPGGSPLTRMCQVLVAVFHKWNLSVPDDSTLLYETPDKSSAIEGSRKLLHTDELRWAICLWQWGLNALTRLIVHLGVVWLLVRKGILLVRKGIIHVLKLSIVNTMFGSFCYV